MVSEATIDKLKGMWYGLFIGDALGASTEFKEKGEFEPITHYTQGVHPIPPGSWTDDGTMALCIAHSFRVPETRGGEFDFSPIRQLTQYYLWMTQGHHSINSEVFDIGSITKASIRVWARDKSVENPGVIGELSQGNGSIIRLAPVIIWGTLKEMTPFAITEYAGLSSTTTHGHRACIDACRYLSIILNQSIHNTPDFLTAFSSRNHLYQSVHQLKPLFSSIHAIAELTSIEAEYECNPSGYVVDTLKCALRACRSHEHSADRFATTLLSVANEGGDADSIGAVAGQIIGTRLGFEEISKTALYQDLRGKWMIEAGWRELLVAGGRRDLL